MESGWESTMTSVKNLVEKMLSGLLQEVGLTSLWQEVFQVSIKKRPNQLFLVDDLSSGICILFMLRTELT